MRGVPSRRRRRAHEGAHPSMRDRARAGDDARSPGPSDRRSRLGCGACRAAGGDEHARERIRRCVTERAQETTPGSAAAAPKMRVRSGGLGLRPHPRPRCELDFGGSGLRPYVRPGPGSGTGAAGEDPKHGCPSGWARIVGSLAAAGGAIGPGNPGRRLLRRGHQVPGRRVRPTETFRLEVDELAEAELTLGVDHHDPHEGRARLDAGMDLRPGNDVVHTGRLKGVFDSCLSRPRNAFGYHVGRPPPAPEPLRRSPATAHCHQ